MTGPVERLMRRVATRDGGAVAAALVAPLAAAAALLPFRASWSNTNVALLLMVVVVGVAAIGNRVAGGLAAVSAAVWFDFFFTVPYYRFTIRSSADITTAVLLLVTGLAVSQLAARARQLKVIAITDAGYLAHIHDTAVLAQSAGSPEAVVDHVKEQLTGLLWLAECRFEFGSLLSHPPRLLGDGTVADGHDRWDVERTGLPPRTGTAGGRQRPLPRAVHDEAGTGRQTVAAGTAGRGEPGRSGRAGVWRA